MTVDAASVEVEPTGLASIPRRIYDNFRTGNLGPAPVLLALAIIVVYFSQTAPNFFTAGNFNNIITQMAGTTLIAFGVVFVLLLGEIDLSVAYVSGLTAVVAAEAPASGRRARTRADRLGLAIVIGVAIGAFQGSFVALIGVPSFVVTLAGFLMWQGMIIETSRGARRDHHPGHLDQQHGELLLQPPRGLDHGGDPQRRLRARRPERLLREPPPRHPSARSVDLRPPAGAAAGADLPRRRDLQPDQRRGVPLALLIVLVALFVLTFLAKRTTFGRHVYAVGGNAEAARRAGINVARIRILVFMIAGAMSAIGGIVLAARLNSVDLNQGGGTLLIDAIAAAVIGGTSLFGGRGEVRNALFGALVIKTIENGLNTKGYSQGIIFIVTGAILLFAVTLDAIARRLQAKSGR